MTDVVAAARGAREFRGLPADAVVIAEGEEDDILVLRETERGVLGDAVFVWSRARGAYEQVAEHVLELWETPPG